MPASLNMKELRYQDFPPKHILDEIQPMNNNNSQGGGSIHLTIDQFMQLGVRCCMCEDLAVWISRVKGEPRMPAYCDRHYPYHDTKDEHDKTRTE